MSRSNNSHEFESVNKTISLHDDINLVTRLEYGVRHTMPIITVNPITGQTEMRELEIPRCKYIVTPLN